MAPMTGVLEWKDTGSLGRTDRECTELHLGVDEKPTKSL